ncbi:transcriptional regulator [Pectobacterium carotovorum subsp. carotovorum]|nr:transcriptional regulator [Pectobacterium carotovorum subsp. carotovorum]
MSAILRGVMDSLNALSVFIQVAESKSFVSTGRQLGISASAVGKSISRLEERFGVRLFQRSTRSLSLTQEGEFLLERSRRILGEVENIEYELTKASTVPEGRLKISLPMVSSLLLPVLGNFMQEYPHIELDLDFSDRLVDVIEEGFDIVIRTGKPSDSRLSMRRMGTFNSVLVASPEYLSLYGVPLIPEDLLDHACLHYRYPQSGKLEQWTQFAKNEDIDLQLPTTVICNNNDTRVSLALQGRGIAFIPVFSIQTALDDGRLCHILSDYIGATGVFNILWPSGKFLPSRTRVLIDYLCDNALRH